MRKALPCHQKPSRLRSSQSSGFSILEVLLAVAVAGVSISILAPALTRQVSQGRAVGSLATLEGAAAVDLAGLRRYARDWQRTSAGNDVASYAPTPCASLATSFLSAASTSNPTDRPIPAASGVQQDITPTTLSADVNPGTTLTRTITAPTAGSSVIYVEYGVDAGSATGLNFRRSAAIYLDASAWCS